MEDNTLHLSLVQGHLVWHKPEKNFLHFSNLISLIDKTDVIILPEMWASGFTMRAHIYHEYADKALQLMKDWSIKHKALIIGSLIVKVDENYRNRSYVVEDGQVAGFYDKRHLFGYAGEDRFFECGDQKFVYDYKGWRICPLICYDLRFPEWCRNQEDYDLLIFSANWPDKRIAAWDNLLKARAIENQCYVAGVNCTGKDIWDNNYVGHSAIISYSGETFQQLKGEEGLLSESINKSDMIAFRNKLPFLKDQDKFKIDL